MRKRSEGVTEATARKVAYQTKLFSDFMSGRGRVFPADITATDAVEFKASWSSWKSSVTRTKGQQNIRGFIRFICKGEHRDEILAAFGKIKATRADSDRLEPKPFTEAELKKLLERVPITFPDSEKAARVAALIHCMVSTGLAIRDTVQLEIANLKGGQLRIRRQKTGKAVTQRLDPALLTELMAVKNGNPKYIFWNGTSLPESATGVWQTDLRTLMEDAGLWIKGNLSHRFRDTFVDFSLGSGWSIDEIAAALGDTVTVVERHYANLASKRMEDRLAKLPVRTW
jgi:integrase